LEETIRLAPTPEEALRIAIESPARPNWEKISPEILYEGFLAQLEQYNELRTLILNTGIRLIFDRNLDTINCTYIK
jgi:predicted NAD-dependent protein-ADP-ribosyltransferase YbiA (DUF1768 family)